MRKLYLLAGLAAVGLGLVGWGTLTTAQPADVEGEEPPMVVQEIELPRGQTISKPIAMPRASEPTRLPDKLPAAVEPETPRPMPMKDVRVQRPAAATEPVEKPGTLLLPPLDQPIQEIQPRVESAKISDQTSAKVVAAGLLPGSKQEPGISLEWHGPPAARVGQASDYALKVRNVCGIPLQKVVVQVRVPEELKVTGTEPRAETTEGVLLWDLGTLAAKQETALRVSVLGSGRGDLTCQAWVTFTGSTVMRIQVREPKLAVRATGPAKVVLGDTADFTFIVTNPGDIAADNARISVTLPEGLESARGRKLDYDIGSIAPGGTRTLQVPCITRSAGEQRCEAVVLGDGGLKAADGVAVAVTQPALDVDVQGPKMRYLDRKAVYTVKVSNPGDAPATGVTVGETLPPGFKFIAADANGQHDVANRSVKWNVGTLEPGQSREMKLEVMAVSAGEHTHKVVASAARGLKAEGSAGTKVEGLSAILMELVDTDDPIEVKAETTYEVRVTNTGSKTETDIKLACTIPPQMELKTATAPVKYRHEGGEVIFDTLPQLAPRADVVFTIVVKAKAKGDARFKAQLTTASLVEPVVKVESTRVYDD